jgi:hypothetical protein
LHSDAVSLERQYESCDQAPSEQDLELTLEAVNASSFPHTNGRSLKSHLYGTYRILQSWKARRVVAIAGLFHSVYSTQSYHHTVVPVERRPALATMLGGEAERLIYLFHRCPLGLLSTVAAAIPEGSVNETIAITKPNAEAIELSSQTLWDLLRIHAANLIEQSQSQDGWPGIYLSQLSALERLARTHHVSICPPLASVEGAIELHDERELRDHYRQAFRENGDIQLSLFARCMNLMPMLAETNLWYGWALLHSGMTTEAKSYLDKAIDRTESWGCSWDKRLPHQDLLRILKKADLGEIEDELNKIAARWREPVAPLPQVTRAADYLSRIRSEGALGWYPGLRSCRWHDGQQFSIVRSLENAFSEIQREVLALDTKGFHEETENIQRTGTWKVFMLWETGRKHRQNCDRLPILTRIMESDDRVRTTSGLIYLSRLAPHTHVAAHRGPTNIRLRLHLPFRVPAGDCAMQVGGEVRSWVEGEAVVFDDLYEHEVWNNTDEDRLVMVADLWHSDLTDTEIELLKALDVATILQAESRARYWANNERQRERERNIQL